VEANTFFSYGFQALTLPQSRDIGLFILDQPVTNIYPTITEYASLAHAGTLAEYTATHPGNTATVRLSGYGITVANGYNNGNGHLDKIVSYRSRLQATAFIVNLNNQLTGGYNVQISANPGGGRGGTCFGDSGGPVLLPGTDVITAVNSFVANSLCAGTGFGYRTDQQDVINWILANAGSEAAEIKVV
jgi:hypothetical protein